MRSILTDTSPAGLRAAIEADLTATRLRNNDVPSEAHDEPDVSWAVPAAPSDMRSLVTRAQFTPETVERRLDELLAALDAHGTKMVWWYESAQRPADLRERLLARRFRSVGDTAAMAIDLERLPDRVDPPAGVRITPVDDLVTIEAYVRLLIQNIEEDHRAVPPGAAEIRRRYLAERLGDDPFSRRFVAWLDGGVVATSRLSMAGGVAGLYTVVTTAEARGRGIGSAMTLTALLAGRDAGMRIGALQATEMGARIYRRLGFEELYRYELLARRPSRRGG